MAARINWNKEIKKFIVDFSNNLKELRRFYLSSLWSLGKWVARRMWGVRVRKNRKI
jgi:hypothetical protein